MLAQSTLSPPPYYHHRLHHHHHHHLSLSFPSGFSNSTLFPSITTTTTTTITTTTIVTNCITDPRIGGNGKGKNKKKPTPTWKIIYKRLSIKDNIDMDPNGVLEDWEKEGNVLTKWEIRRFVKELRTFGRNKTALEAFEWMTNKKERFRISPGDIAIQLDLVTRVHGISGAEDYFLKLPNSLKDNRVYGSLLNAYASAKLEKKAESLMAKMKERGDTTQALPFNVIMTLYMNLKHYDKIESTISEMIEKKVALDIYSYNIWLSSCGYQGSAEKMEQVFERMKFERKVSPNWTTFSTMAGIYIKLGQLEKAEDNLKKVESKIQGRDRAPYHYLITHYGYARNKNEIQRIWSNYKIVFPFIPNKSYLNVISSLVKVDAIEDAEKIYEEWLSVKTNYDPRIGNCLLGWYVAKGEEEKAETFFAHMGETGKRRNSRTWEIMAEVFLKDGNISKAVDYLAKASVAEGFEYWNINPVNVTTIFNFCEREGDTESKEILLGVLKQIGCFEDEAYRSFISSSDMLVSGNETANLKGRINEDSDEMFEDQLLASF